MNIFQLKFWFIASGPHHIRANTCGGTGNTDYRLPRQIECVQKNERDEFLRKSFHKVGLWNDWKNVLSVPLAL